MKINKNSHPLFSMKNVETIQTFQYCIMGLALLKKLYMRITILSELW